VYVNVTEYIVFVCVNVTDGIHCICKPFELVRFLNSQEMACELQLSSFKWYILLLPLLNACTFVLVQ